ncbi:MAG: ABC transporter substrate-binding protein [Bilifractor sp.]|jgi:multiple sugar transport system substrate-binding protein
MKKNKNKVIYSAISLVMVAALFSGCGSGSSAGTTASSEAVNGSSGTGSAGIKQFAGTTLYMIAEQQTPTESLINQLDQFEELTGITVEVEMAPFDDVIQKETLAFKSGSGAYDVIAAPYQMLGNMVENKYIQSIEPLMEDESLAVIPDYDSDDIIEEMWKASGEWKDGLYGVPANSCIDIFMYRKDLFENKDEQEAFKEKYGYDLTVPTDWDTYRDVAEFFTRKAGDTLMGETLSSDVYGVAMSGKRHDATTCEWMNYMWSFGGGIFDDEGNPAVNSEKCVEALQYYKDLSAFAPPGVTGTTWDECTTELQQGICAMAILFNDCAPALEDEEQSAVAGKMGYGAIPVKEKEVAHYGGWGYYIPTDSKNPEAAWLFLQWFNTPDVQKQIALDGGFVNLNSVYDDEELNKLPYWQASKDAYAISTTRPRIAQWNEMDNALMLELSNCLSGDETPQEALDKANDEFTTILEGNLPVTYQ